MLILLNVDFPAAFFNDPATFSVDNPNYINYGLFGSTIGHEIIHAFDIEGSKRDWNGNKNNWWSPETKQLYNNKSQCIVEQYSKFTMFNMTVSNLFILNYIIL